MVLKAVLCYNKSFLSQKYCQWLFYGLFSSLKLSSKRLLLLESCRIRKWVILVVLYKITFFPDCECAVGGFLLDASQLLGLAGRKQNFPGEAGWWMRLKIPRLDM